MYAITNYKRLCTDRQTDADANMYGVALKFYRERGEWSRVQEQLFRFDPFYKEKH